MEWLESFSLDCYKLSHLFTVYKGLRHADFNRIQELIKNKQTKKPCTVPAEIT